MSNSTMSLKIKERNAELKKLTYECVTSALLSLMSVHDFDDISITELCKKAGVSRNTFYKSFGTKENAFRYIAVYINRDVIFRKLGNPFRNDTDKSWYVKFFEIVREHAAWFKTIMQSKLVYEYMQYVNQLLVSPSMNYETRYTRLMWSGAVQNATAEWIRTGMTIAPDEIAEICFNRITAGNKK